MFAREASTRVLFCVACTGKVRYVTRDLPLPDHKLAVPAARACRCAGEQGRSAFGECLRDTARFDKELQKDRADAADAGIAGTPSFVVGRTTAGPLEGIRILGAVSFAAMEAAVMPLLANPNGTEPPRD